MVERDEQLAHKVQQGDTEVFGELVARYQDKLLRYGRKFLSDRDDIEDLVQGVFIKAYEGINGFDVRRPFSPWVYRIAHNEFVNALGSSHRAAELLVDWDTFLPQPVAPERADRDAVDRELMEHMGRCLGKLDPKYREPLILFYEQSLSYEEIADVLHIPVATVGVRLHRARDALRKRCTDLLR